MNISSAKKPILRNQVKKTVFKPVEEKWTVGEKSYNSTSDLLADTADLNDVKATYHFRSQDKPAPYTQGERLQNAVGYGLYGAAGGAAVGMLGTGLMAGLGLFVGFVSIIHGGPAEGISEAAMLAPMAIGAAVGAVTRGVVGYGKQADPGMKTVSGVLQNEGDNLNFFPQGNVQKKVDLKSFDQATTPEISPEKKASVSTKRGILTGAAAGAAAPLVSLIPLVNLITMPAAGAALGESIGGTRTALPSGLGGAVGAGVLVGSYAAMATGNWLALAGGMGLAGAALGKSILTKVESQPAQRKYGDQWWNEKQKEQFTS